MALMDNLKSFWNTLNKWVNGGSESTSIPKDTTELSNALKNKVINSGDLDRLIADRQTNGETTEDMVVFQELIDDIKTATEKIEQATTSAHIKRHLLTEAYLIYTLLKYLIPNAYKEWQQLKDIINTYQNLRNEDSNFNNWLNILNTTIRELVEDVYRDSSLSTEEQMQKILDLDIVGYIDTFLNIGLDSLGYDYLEVVTNYNEVANNRYLKIKENENLTDYNISSISVHDICVGGGNGAVVFNEFIDNRIGNRTQYGTFEAPLITDTFKVAESGGSHIYYSGDYLWFNDGTRTDLYLCINDIDYNWSGFIDFQTSQVGLDPIFSKPTAPYFYKFGEDNIAKVNVGDVYFDRDSFDTTTNYITSDYFNGNIELKMRRRNIISDTIDFVTNVDTYYTLPISMSEKFVRANNKYTKITIDSEGNQSTSEGTTGTYYINNTIDMKALGFLDLGDYKTCIIKPLEVSDSNSGDYFSSGLCVLGIYDGIINAWDDPFFINAEGFTVINLQPKVDIVAGNPILTLFNAISKLTCDATDPTAFSTLGLNNLQTTIAAIDNIKKSTLPFIQSKIDNGVSDIHRYITSVAFYTGKETLAEVGTITNVVVQEVDIENSEGEVTSELQETEEVEEGITTEIITLMSTIETSLIAMQELEYTEDNLLGSAISYIQTNLLSGYTFDYFIENDYDALNTNMEKLLSMLVTQTQVFRIYIPQMEQYMGQQEPFMGNNSNYSKQTKDLIYLFSSRLNDSRYTNSSSTGNNLKIAQLPNNIRLYDTWYNVMVSKTNEKGYDDPFRPFMVDSIYQHILLYLSIELGRKLQPEQIQTENGILDNTIFLETDVAIMADVLDRAIMRGTINSKQLTDKYNNIQHNITNIGYKYGITVDKYFNSAILPNSLTTIFPELRILNDVNMIDFIDSLKTPTEIYDVDTLYNYNDSSTIFNDPIISTFKFIILKCFIKKGYEYIDENIVNLLDILKYNKQTVRLEVFKIALNMILVELVGNGKTTLSTKTTKVIQNYLNITITGEANEMTDEEKNTIIDNKSKSAKISLGLQKYIIENTIFISTLDNFSNSIISEVDSTGYVSDSSFKHFLLNIDGTVDYEVDPFYNASVQHEDRSGYNTANAIFSVVGGVALLPANVVGVVGQTLWNVGGNVVETVSSPVGEFFNETAPEAIKGLIDSGKATSESIWKWMIGLFLTSNTELTEITYNFNIDKLMDIYNKINLYANNLKIGLNSDVGEKIYKLVNMTSESLSKILNDLTNDVQYSAEYLSQLISDLSDVFIIDLDFNLNKVESDLNNESNAIIINAEKSQITINGPILLQTKTLDKTINGVVPKLSLDLNDDNFNNTREVRKRYFELLDEWMLINKNTVNSLYNSVDLYGLKILMSKMFKQKTIDTPDTIPYFLNNITRMFEEYFGEIYDIFSYNSSDVGLTDITHLTMDLNENREFYNDLRMDIATTVLTTHVIGEEPGTIQLDTMNYFYEDIFIAKNFISLGNKIYKVNGEFMTYKDLKKLTYYIKELLQPYADFYYNNKDNNEILNNTIMFKSDIPEDLPSFTRIFGEEYNGIVQNGLYKKALEYMTEQSNVVMETKKLIKSFLTYLTEQDHRFIQII